MSKKASRDIIFGTSDYFGNLVTLHRKTWAEHIVDEHASMSGYETLVEAVIKDPAEIRISTWSDTSVAFISDSAIGPSAEGIRVLVDYDDRFYEKGSSTGIVTTAYPIDLINYRNPRIGRAIYKRGGRK